MDPLWSCDAELLMAPLNTYGPYGQRNQVDAHWKRCLSFLRIGLSWMRQGVADSSKTLLAWAPIPLRKLESCIRSQSSQQNQRLPWFSKVDLPPPLDRNVPTLGSSASQMRSVSQAGRYCNP